MKLLLNLLVTAVALFVATRFVPGIHFTGDNYGALIGVALVFGAVNIVVKPILTLFSFPVVMLTLGLFLLVINGLMLMLTSFVAQRLAFGFHVDGLVPAIIGSLVVSLASWAMHLVLGTNRGDG